MDIKQFVTSVDREGFTVAIPVDRSFNTSGDGYWSNTRASVKVESISIYVGLEDDGDGYWGDGDLAINHEDDPGMSWDTETLGLIYTDGGFIEAVREWMIQQGWDAAADEDIGDSEQGMQDIGRVSCDAYEFAGYLRRLYQEQAQPA